jgi:peptidyl-prolyl cis-trans isomerase SurA
MRKTLSLITLVLLLAPPCLPDVMIVEEIIAKVNGDIVTRSEYDKALSEVRAGIAADQGMSEAERQEALVEAEKNALRNVIDERLLIQRGQDLNINVEAQALRQRDELMRRYDLKTIEEFETWATETAHMPMEDLMEQLRNSVLTQNVLGQEVGSRITIPRPEIEAYYQEHKDEFMRTEGVRLREILISTEGKSGDDLAAAEKKAKEVLERVKKGEPFPEMARRMSENPASAPNGGDIGIFRKGQLKKEIEDEVFSQNPGYITDLIKLPNGYLILKVDQRYREGLAELEEVEGEIHNRLANPKWGPEVRNFLSELRKDAYIEIRPGYIDSGAVEGMDTSWSDPARLAPVTTTREEVLQRKKDKRLLWVIPLPGGGDKTNEQQTPQPAAGSVTQPTGAGG